MTRNTLIIVAGATVAAVMIAGCRYPEPEFRPGIPLRAAAEHDRAAIPELISMLYSDDPLERMLAVRALREITGLTHDYDHSAPQAQREAAAERWAQWYRSQAEDGAH